ncbi:alkaline shock response membrane anchor protein AmaP [Streptomyces ficellus]|uniref:Alkaline shock response membrane anchor protein AmaP n=2 Tax=Streptomyces ficellus TaxID=1977088 RepID=A0ABT7ZE63_9ACTN|nr:alkaline shock response membrane anchor protein AmaP [Streptomyces ficellus]MDN3297795.1 alkaline shock response membrane anchor protein AmaP [Streptomyces ficellus]
MLRAVNRVLLGLVGAALLCAGGAVLAAGLDLEVPSWSPWRGPDAVLLSEAARKRWGWPVVITALAVLVLLVLWWLLAQLRRPRLAEVLIDSRDGEGAVLRGRALEGAMESEAGALDGVSRARVRLTGRRTAPSARVSLLLEPYASPDETLSRLRDGALRHARESAGLLDLPTEAQLRAAKHQPRRVS